MIFMDTKRTEFDIGEILRSHGQEYECTHSMYSEQRKAFRAIASCRTSVLGGHKFKCTHCSYEEISYNSCRNNNCPKCQGIKRREWVGARIEELLPVPYFHLIFTISDFFNDLHYSHYKELYSAIFSASSGALLYFFKKRGGIPAITSIAHSWGQTMSIHPHVHMLVTGGCLSFDKKEWIRIGNNYLFDVKALSAEFKKRFLKEINKRIPQLVIPESVKDKDWVVFSKKPFAGTEVVVKYLGRYVNRSAIANSRIKDVTGGKVTFEYKNYRRCDKNDIPATGTMCLEADEFIRRFMQHIPPDNFRRIRFYGITAGKDCKAKLQAARELTFLENFTLQEPATPVEAFETLIPHLCPQCKTGSMEIVDTLLPHGPPLIIFRNEIRKNNYAA